MPALPEEIAEAEKEGVTFQFLVAPVEVLGNQGRAQALKLEYMRLGEFDKSGRRRPEPTGQVTEVAANVVIAAIGQTADLSWIPASMGLETGRGVVIADSRTMATNVPGIFAGGDCVTGPDTVIQAIAAGKKAAASIDKYLGGDGMVAPPLEVERKVSGEIIEQEARRIAEPALDVSDRLGSFKEVELGFDEEMAVAEASRCLRCDVTD